MNASSDRSLPAPRSAVAALLQVREWRVEQARLHVDCSRRELDLARAAARRAGDRLAEASSRAVSAAVPAPALHARTLHHLARLANEAQGAAADLERRQSVADDSCIALQVRSRDLEALRKAWDRSASERRAQRVRTGWRQADDAWLAARSAGAGA